MKKPKSKTGKGFDKLLGLGQMVGVIPEARAIRDEVKALLDAGGSDAEARELAIAKGREFGIVNPRTFLPALSRKLMRMDFRAFLREAANWLADRSKGKQVGDIADELWSKVGVEDWWADYILDWARDPNGDPGAFLPQFGGKTWAQKLGMGEDQVQVVTVIITPLSHPRELLKEAMDLCLQVMPEGTWSRYGADVEGPRLWRLKLEVPGRSWGDVAEILLDEREPYLRDLETEDFRVAKEAERQRITVKANRWYQEYADSFFSQLSAESE
jgi:hypothetical protein